MKQTTPVVSVRAVKPANAGHGDGVTR